MAMRYLETRTVPIADLQPYPGNARVHDEAALDESAQVNGQYRSVVAREVDGGFQLLAGHGTVAAFGRQGVDAVRVEVIEADDTQARRIVLADNGTARNAGYDDRLLLDLIDQASRDGGLGGTGWDAEAYKELLDSAGSENPFDYSEDGEAGEQEPPAEPITQPGDLWLLGRHRLACGDSLDAATVELAVNGQAVAVVHTDPPYGIAIVNDAGKVGHHTGTPFRGIAKGSGKVIKTTEYAPVIGDETTDTAAQAFSLLTKLYPKARHVWWGGNHYASSAGLPDTSCWLIWDKQTDGNTFADAELAWTNHGGAVRIFRHMWSGMMRASERGKRVHPTQKPVVLAEWVYETVDRGGAGLVLDVFGGSGSSLVAAETSGRPAAIVEMSPAYCDVIARRYQDLTGDKPVLERTGEPYDFTAGPPCVAA